MFSGSHSLHLVVIEHIFRKKFNENLIFEIKCFKYNVANMSVSINTITDCIHMLKYLS